MKRKLKIFPIIIFVTIFIMLIILLVTIKSNSKKKVNETKTTSNTKVNDKRKMSIVMVGDVLTHDAVLSDALNSDGSYEFSKMFTYIKPMIEKYDLRYVNQESIIGGPSFKYSGYPTFNAPDSIGDNLVDTGFNVIGLANNHAFDKGEKAILYSNDYWNSKNVITAGTYSSYEEQSDIKIYEKNGIKYTFLAYTTSINGYNLPADKAYLVNIYSNDRVKSDVDKVKDKVDVIIVAMHWGDEYTNTPTESEKEIANYLSSLGVDLVIGTHPHVVQPIEYIDNTLVIYSLGNFISNQLVLGLNPAIGLMVGVQINLDNGNKTINIIDKELLYSYSSSSKDFKVIPFSKLNDETLKDYKKIESEYMSIVGDVN